MTNLSDYAVSLIRTWVPVGIGIVLAFLAQKLGLEVDGAGLSSALTGFCIALYYALVRKLEEKYPQFGWLLGSPSKPKYHSE